MAAAVENRVLSAVVGCVRQLPLSRRQTCPPQEQRAMSWQADSGLRADGLDCVLHVARGELSGHFFFLHITLP